MAYAFQGIGKFSQIFLPWDLSPETYAINTRDWDSVSTRAVVDFFEAH